jgi:hypothetical protein
VTPDEETPIRCPLHALSTDYSIMSNRERKQARDYLTNARKQFLTALPEWHELPSAADPMTGYRRLLLDRVRRRMVDAGLYAVSNERRAVRWGIRRLVSEVRGQAIRRESARES